MHPTMATMRIARGIHGLTLCNNTTNHVFVQTVASTTDGSVPGGEANRLPWAVAVVVRPESWEVEVHQADTPQQLFELLGGCSRCVLAFVIELTDNVRVCVGVRGRWRCMRLLEPAGSGGGQGAPCPATGC